jgi:hypothetical protein
MLEEIHEAQNPGKHGRSRTSFQFYFISNILQSALLMFTTQVAAVSDITEIKCTTLKYC